MPWQRKENEGEGKIKIQKKSKFTLVINGLQHTENMDEVEQNKIEDYNRDVKRRKNVTI